MTPDGIAETIVASVTGLSLVGALIAREAVKRGWVRLSLSFAVIPLERRGKAPAVTQEQPPAAVKAA